MKNKKCPICGKTKPLSEFHKSKVNKFGRAYRCKQCTSIWSKDYHRKNKEERNKKHQEYYKNNTDVFRNKEYKRLYEITLEDYNKMFEEQQGRCAICGKHVSEFKSNLAVDHCHKSGKIRGLLCVSCNTKLSVVEDNDFVKMATKYLSVYADS